MDTETELYALRQFRSAVLIALGKPVDAEHEIDKVNYQLRAAGIEYPTGARGVADLRNLLAVAHQRYQELGEALRELEDEWDDRTRNTGSDFQDGTCQAFGDASRELAELLDRFNL